MKIKRRFPNFFSGFEKDETEHEVKNYNELSQLAWIKPILDKGDKLEYSLSSFNDCPHSLMAVHDSDVFFVIGHIFGDPTELGIKKWKEK